MAAPVQIILFGTPTITVQGEPLTINRFQIRAFLLRLAAQAEPVARDQLAQLFWPALDDARARRHLTQLLSHVRRALPLPKLLLQTPAHVHLNQAQIWSDVVAFKQLVADSKHATGVVLQETLDSVINLYDGPFLDGISTPDLPDYELWLQSERAWLERRYLDLLALRTLDLMVQEAFPPAIELLRRHLAINEFAEEAHRRLIACYAAVGERSAALHQYEQCIDLLQRELGVEPMAETVALHQAVLRGAPWSELASLVLPASLQKAATLSSAVTAIERVPTPPRDNLPHEPLPIIGRHRELATLATLLTDPQNRLVTIVGVGGMGKTRLALAAAQAQRALGNFSDGIYFVPLVALTDPQQIVPAILQALHLSTATGPAQARTPLAQLLDFLREKHLLLLLDNFEHLLDGAEVVAQIARAAPGVHLLVTSRKVLGVHGEQLFPLNELPYPQREQLPETTMERATTPPSDYPAIQLFLQSAQRSAPHFALTTANQADVVRVCQLVGGMPLALELAASWVTMLSAAEIGIEIAGSLDFLEAEIHDLPVRHQSVRALLDVVWQQLNAAERAIFTRFAIFQGGFTRQAAHEVAGASLHTLRSLTTNLFLHYNEAQGKEAQGDEAHGRYSSHELLRTYGVEQLTTQPHVYREMQERHSRYYSALLLQLEPELKGARQQAAFVQLAAEQANLQAAWTWAVAETRLELLEQSIAGLGHLYAWMGNQSDGNRIFETLVQHLETQVDDPAEQWDDATTQGRMVRLLAEGLAWLAHFTLMAGQVDQAKAQLQRSFAALAKATALGVDCRGQRALALLHLGHLERPRDLTAAAQAYDQSRGLYEQLDLAWEHAYATSWLGEAEHLIGQQEAAIALLTEARSTFETLGDQRNVARVLASVADSYLLDMADLEAAQATAAASLRMWRATGDQLGIANTAVILAYAHCWLNRPDLADPLIDEALAIYRHHGDRYGECRVYYMVMVVANYRSDIVRKETSARDGLQLARALGDAKLISDFSRGLANVYMARGDFASAYPLHAEAIAVQEAAGVQALMPWLHIVRAYSSWKTGKWEEARDHLAYALRVSAENADVFSAVYAIFFVAQLLQAQGNLERATELYALAQRDYMWQGSLSGDVIMVKPLHTLESALPPAVYAAAHARGETLDLLATATHYAVAIQDPTWQW